MNRILLLIKGEFQRLNRYNMLKINLVVIIFYLIIAYFVEGEEIKQFIPFLILIDSSMMTTLLVGATLFYEKKEHTMNTLIVSPATTNEILLAKISTSVLNSVLSVIFIAVGVYLIKGLTINILTLSLITILVSAFHTILGILLSYKAKDFTGMLMLYIAYVFVFMFPTIFFMAGVIDESVAKYFIFFPPEASNVLFMSTITDTENWKIIFSASYLVTLSFTLYIFLVKPLFHKYAIKEVGV